MRDWEAQDDTQMDELLRLAQEDIYAMKRGYIEHKSELEKLYEGVLKKDPDYLEKELLQQAKGDVDNITEDMQIDKEIQRRHWRKLGNTMADVIEETKVMRGVKDLKEDDEAKRRRRANAFSLAEFDEERGYSDEAIEIPDKVDYGPLETQPPTFDLMVDQEADMLVERLENRMQSLNEAWREHWTPKGTKIGEDGKPDFWTRILRRYPSLRKGWADDDRCWRRPDDWHQLYSPSSRLRLTDGTRLHRDLVELAYANSLKAWEACPSTQDVDLPIETTLISELLAPPAISPSIWTYPGNLVCFMDKRGTLDFYQRHSFDRDVWWAKRLQMPDSFLKQIPEDYDISAVQVGDHHLAIFSYQRFFYDNVPTSPYGACWMVPKAELSTGANVLNLPHVPLKYYTPFAAKDALFVIGYDSHKDSHYTILALRWNSDTVATWEPAETQPLPLFWPSEVLIGDYPESLYRLGTASICTSQDESQVFITVPTDAGQNIISIDCATLNFTLEPCSVPPVWGASLIHDALHNRLILAGGLGIYSPEPIIRCVDLFSGEWYVERGGSAPNLGAYAGSFPIGPGSFAIVGGFWYTGHKKLNLQPSTAITLIETTDAGDYRFDELLRKFGPVYFPNGLPEEGAEEGELADAAPGSPEESEFDV